MWGSVRHCGGNRVRIHAIHTMSNNILSPYDVSSFTRCRIKSDGRYKSRVVACGNRQARDDLDLYSPTPRLSTVRVLLHQAVNNDWAANVSDVSVAFLNSRLQKPIYCHLPSGRQKPGEKKQVMRCQKALYGILSMPLSSHALFSSCPMKKQPLPHTTSGFEA